MTAKEIEKLIRIYVPSGTLLGSNRAKFIAELQNLHQEGLQEKGQTYPLDAVSKSFCECKPHGWLVEKVKICCRDCTKEVKY